MKTSNMLSIMVVTLIILFGMSACKTATNTATKEIKETDSKTVAKDTSAPSPLNKLQNLGSNVKTEVVKEAKSGMEADLPFDKEVRTGKLDNGMRYYIRKNGKPEQRVEMRLAINAGSMQEEETQRGLAHFVEHMCFNGTESFEKNALVNFLELTGVRFGADLNAYTSFDETVYMLQLPTDTEGLVEKGLLVLHDWAGAVTFADEEIDKERGVIVSEWRTRLGADERMREVYWPKMFYKSRYADRLPIGTTEVITKAPYERLKTFYKDWYRPDLMALVVVGDLELDDIETKIKSQFGKLENPEKPKEKILFDVPGHKETFVSVATDKEATNVSFQIIHKHQPENIKTLDDFRSALMHQLYNRMVNARYDEMGETPNVPFTRAFSAYTSFVRSMDAYFVQAIAKENSIEECLRAVMTEQVRIKKHGFTDTELERAKLSLLKSFKNAYKERDKTTSARFAAECVSNFLEDSPMFGIEKELALAKEFVPSIKLTEVNALATKWITNENRAVVLTAPAKEGLKIPTEENIAQIIKDLDNVEVEPYKDKFLDIPLMPAEPKAGKVTAEKTMTEKEINITEFTLSNGVKVVMKPTDFQNDQIMLSAYSPGGHSIYDDKDYLTAANADEIVVRAGVSDFDRIALNKKLTGKTVRVSPYIGELYEGFSGNASVEDVETMFQLVHLYATKPRKDKEAFETMLNELMEENRNAMSNPQQYFFNEYQKASSGNSIRRQGIFTEEELKSIDFERAHEIYADRFSDFSDFTFTLIGNFEPEKIKPLLEKYIASLPSTNRKENWKDVGIYAPKEAINLELKKGLAAQSNVIISFQKDEKWDRVKAMNADAMSAVLNIMVRENLREDKGGVYSPFVGGGLGREPHGTSQVVIFFQCAPEDVEKLVEAVKEEIKSLQTNGPSADNMAKVKETRRRGLETNMKRNNFWMGTITESYKNNESPTQVFDTEQMIDDLKAEDIKKTANSLIDLNKGIIVTIKPEAKSDNDGKP